MALVNLSDILPEVAPDVPGCPVPVMLNAIRKAAITLCEKSEAWEADLTPIITAAGVSDYVITQPASQRVVRLSRAIGANGVIEPTTEDTLDAANPNWRVATSDYPLTFVMLTPRIMRIYPIPTVSGVSIAIKAVLKPSPTGTVIDDYIYDDLYQGIAAGAKETLAAMPGKEWTNLDMVVYYAQVFNHSIVDAKVRKARSYSNARTSIANTNSWGG